MAIGAGINNVTKIVEPFASPELMASLKKRIGKSRETHRNPVTGDWDVTSDAVPIGRTYENIDEHAIQNFLNGLERIASKYKIIGHLSMFVVAAADNGKVTLMCSPHFWTADAEALMRESKEQIDRYFNE